MNPSRDSRIRENCAIRSLRCMGSGDQGQIGGLDRQGIINDEARGYGSPRAGAAKKSAVWEQ